MIENSLDDELRVKLEAIDLHVRKACDFIPIQHWGFDDSVRERLKHRKFQAVGQKLSKDDKKQMSNRRKHQLARQLGAVPNTVSDVLEWMSTHPSLKNLQVKPPPEKTKDSVVQNSPTKMKETLVQKTTKARKENKSSDSEEDFDREIKPETLRGQIFEETTSEESGEEEISDSKDIQPNGKVQRSKALIMKRKVPENNAEQENKKPKLEEPDISAHSSDTRQSALDKLKNKLESLKAIRRGKKSAEDYEMARKLKRQVSKLKLKQKRVEEKNTPQTISTPKVESPIKNEENAKIALKSEQAVVDGITYSKFDFIVRDEKKPLTKREKRDKFTGKDFKRLIEKAEHRNEKIESIRAKNPEKAKHIEENIKWNKVLQHAEGQKVRDNVDLLKRAAKRKEKTKERSKRKWDDREKTIEEKQAKRQEKRQANIGQRKDAIKKRKMDKLRKKGRIL